MSSNPELFPVLLMVSVGLGTAIHLSLAAREGLPCRALLLAYGLIVAAFMLGAKAHSLLADGAPNSLGAFMLQGFRAPGGIAAGLLLLPVARRLLPEGLNALRWLDLLMPGTAVALAIMRIECIVAGCCSGSVCMLPWGWRYAAATTPWYAQLAEGQIRQAAEFSLPVHPLPLYFIVLAMGAFVVSLRALSRNDRDGTAFFSFLAIYGFGQFLIDFLRHPAVLSAQLGAGCLGVAGVVGLVHTRARRAKKETAGCSPLGFPQ